MSAAEAVIAAARERLLDEEGCSATEDEIVSYSAGFLDALWLTRAHPDFAGGFLGELIRQVGADDESYWREWTAAFVRTYGSLWADEHATGVACDGGPEGSGGIAPMDSPAIRPGMAADGVTGCDAPAIVGAGASGHHGGDGPANGDSRHPASRKRLRPSPTDMAPLFPGIAGNDGGAAPEGEAGIQHDEFASAGAAVGVIQDRVTGWDAASGRFE